MKKILLVLAFVLMGMSVMAQTNQEIIDEINKYYETGQEYAEQENLRRH